MKKSKLLIPLAASILNIHSVKNSYPLRYKEQYQQELLQRKKEYYEETIKSIFPHLDSVKYRADIDVHGIDNFWQTPEETDSLMTGDCEDKAFLAYSLLRKKGLDVNLVWGRLHNNSTVNHVWLEYKIGSKEYIIEPTSKTGAKIKNKDSIDFKNFYIKYVLYYHQLNVIDDFEKISGLELKFGNPILIK